MAVKNRQKLCEVMDVRVWQNNFLLLRNFFFGEMRYIFQNDDLNIQTLLIKT